MRVLAARFPDRRKACAVRDLLRRKLDGDPPVEVDIAALATPGEESTTETVLAGSFADEQASEVTALVRNAGGEIVVNVDERWTRPRPARNGPKWGQRLDRDGARA